MSSKKITKGVLKYIDIELDEEIKRIQDLYKQYSNTQLSYKQASRMLVANKKSELNTGLLFIKVIVMLVVILFMYEFLFESFKQFGVNVVYNISTNSSLPVDASMTAFMSNSRSAFDSFNIRQNYIPILVLVMFYAEAVMSAILSKRLSNARFFFNLTIVNSILLFVMTLVSAFIQYFYNNYYLKLLTNLSYSNASMYFIVQHSTLIVFLMFTSILLINQFSFFDANKQNEFESESMDELNDVNADDISEDIEE